MMMMTFISLVLLAVSSSAFADQGDIDFIGNSFYCSNDVTVVDVSAANGGYSAQGGGCLQRSIADVWNSLKKPLIWGPKAQDAGIKSITDLPQGAALGWTQSYSVRTMIGPISYTSRWDMDWIHFVDQGSEAHPTKILIRYKKVSGESHIKFWSGIISLTAMSSDETAVSVRDEVDAPSTGNKDEENTIRFVMERAGGQ